MNMKPYEKVLQDYFREGRAVTYDRHEILLDTDMSRDEILFVDKGFVRVYSIDDDGECRILAIKGAGELIPLSTLFSDDSSLVYYEAITPVVVRKMTRRCFEEAIQTTPQLAYAVLQSSLQVVREYQQRLENLEMKDARSRIVYRLLFLRRKFGELASQGVQHVIGVPINYQDLADAVNISRETANREMSKLAEQGVVKKRRNSVIVLDRNRLKRLIGY